MEKAELIDRQQPMFLSLEDVVADESMVRVIDRFVDVCDLKQMRLQSIGAETTGRPAYAAAALGRLYVYGYTNGIRSETPGERHQGTVCVETKRRFRRANRAP